MASRGMGPKSLAVTDAPVGEPDNRTLEEVEADIHAAIDKAGRPSPRFMYLAMLWATLSEQGIELRPPWIEGGHTTIRFPGGEVISLKEFESRLRVSRITRATCASCGEPIPIKAYARIERGARVDRKYCSDACRQAAYRARFARKVAG